MLNWIESAAGSIAGWLGDGFAGLFSWLLSGLETVLTKVVRAFDSLWELMDAIWDFATGILDSVMRLFSIFFPFFPAEVATVITLALLSAAIAGIYKHVRR